MQPDYGGLHAGAGGNYGSGYAGTPFHLDHAAAHSAAGGRTYVYREQAGPAAGGSGDSLQDEYNKQGIGKIVYNPPARMVMKVTKTVTVRIHRNSAPMPGDARLAGDGTPVTEPLKVGREMKVLLTGDNFTVTSTSGVKQFIPDGGYADWIFHVTPTAQGPQILTLQAAVVLSDNPESETDLPSIERKIDVTVAPPPPPPPLPWWRIVLNWAMGLGKWIAGLVSVAATTLVGLIVKRWWDTRQARI